jgi:hypothetical protein
MTLILTTHEHTEKFGRAIAGVKWNLWWKKWALRQRTSIPPTALHSLNIISKKPYNSLDTDSVVKNVQKKLVAQEKEQGKVVPVLNLKSTTP